MGGSKCFNVTGFFFMLLVFFTGFFFNGFYFTVHLLTDK